MDFKESTDALGLAAPELAEAFGVSPQTIRQMRLDPSNPGHRAPPSEWRAVLARLARERAQALLELAGELEEAAGE